MLLGKKETDGDTLTWVFFHLKIWDISHKLWVDKSMHEIFVFCMSYQCPEHVYARQCQRRNRLGYGCTPV
jgi:hypothetical protein